MQPHYYTDFANELVLFMFFLFDFLFIFVSHKF